MAFPLFQTEADIMEAMKVSSNFGQIMAVIAGMMLIFLVIGIALYIYFSFAMMKVAKRLKVEPVWLAWIPIGNLYLMSKMAKQQWWPILLILTMFIPIIGLVGTIAFTVFMYIWLWKICEARGKPGWWALIGLIPFIGIIWNIILWGILAFGKD